MEVRQLQSSDTESLARTFATSMRPADFFQRCERDQWSGKRVVLVAFEPTGPAGFAVLTWRSNYPPFEFAGVPEIGELTVANGPKADTIARALLAQAELLVQERGYARVGLSAGAGDLAERFIAQSEYLPDGRGRHLTRGGPVEYFIKLLTAPAVLPSAAPKPRPTHWGWRLAATYILLIAMAAGYVTYRVLFAGPRSQYAAIVLVLLSYPWGRLLANLFRIRGGAGATLIILVSYAINAGLLYMIGRAAGRLMRGGEALKSSHLRSDTP
jgi:hypothetical protein